jgi:hypothetical protein
VTTGDFGLTPARVLGVLVIAGAAAIGGVKVNVGGDEKVTKVTYTNTTVKKVRMTVSDCMAISGKEPVESLTARFKHDEDGGSGDYLYFPIEGDRECVVMTDYDNRSKIDRVSLTIQDGYR